MASAMLLLAAVVWLGSRVFRGLDFTDEMQYYGEIAGLVRTGKLFQGDLFIQQFGYIFYLPFFKLHAWVFPDLSYFVLVGRLLLLGTYAATGLLFWRATGKAGGFSPVHRLLGLAAFFVWVPFQVFALGYNSMAYLLVVALLSFWLARTRARFTRYAIGIAPLLAVLTFTYPPAGLVLIVVAAAEARWSSGRREAGQLIGFIALGGLVISALIVVLQGGQVFADIALALKFSRAFGAGTQIARGGQIPNLLVLFGAPTVLLAYLNLPGGIRSGAEIREAQPARCATITLLAMGGAVVWRLSVKSGGGFTATAAYAMLLMLLAVAVNHAQPQTGSVRQNGLHGFAASTIVLGAVTMLLVTAERSPTAYFAATVYLALLLVLAVTADAREVPPISALAIVGTLLGTVFSISSGNGLHNFGVGAAGAIPFLTMFCARRLEASATLPTLLRPLVLPAILTLFLLNSLLTAYSEERNSEGLAPIRGVPAFAGISTCSTKLEAIAKLRQLFADGSLRGKRVLVAGPHPWLYFATGAQPATPMFFMHFTGNPAVYEVVAQQLFRTGLPDAVFITNLVPPPIQQRILEWAGQNTTIRTVKLSSAFIDRYQTHTNFEFDREIHLIIRDPSKPVP